MAKRNKIKNMFFIQRAAIDVLLLNNATALDICTYLVISKYADRYGYYSGVGYKTIKERLGVGQKKIDIAVKRLRSMEYEGQRLLYSVGEWMFKETGDLPVEKSDFGWVRGWFESEYKHQVWLNNDLVGCNGDKNNPLKYFTRLGDHDIHAKLLLLMYKYCNRQYSGVNLNFASIRTQIESSYLIKNVMFHKSNISGYHISNNVLNLFNIYLSEKEITFILNELQKNGFLNVSLSALGDHDGPDIPTGKPKKHPVSSDNNQAPSIMTEKRPSSAKQREAYNLYLETQIGFSKMKNIYPDLRVSSKLAIKYIGKNGDNSFHIKLKKVLKTTPLIDFASISCAPLMEYSAIASEPNPKFVYRLDYKSINKRILKLDDCLATNVEGIVIRNGLEPASRKGKFYKSYWWFDPEVNAIDLIGVLMPSFTPYSELAVHSKAQAAFDEMLSYVSYQTDKVENEVVPRV